MKKMMIIHTCPHRSDPDFLCDDCFDNLFIDLQYILITFTRIFIPGTGGVGNKWDLNFFLSGIFVIEHIYII